MTLSRALLRLWKWHYLWTFTTPPIPHPIIHYDGGHQLNHYSNLLRYVNFQSFVKDSMPGYKRLCILFERAIENIGAKCFSMDWHRELMGWCNTGYVSNLDNWTADLQKFNCHQNNLLLCKVCNCYSNRLPNQPKHDFLSALSLFSFLFNSIS